MNQKQIYLKSDYPKLAEALEALYDESNYVEPTTPIRSIERTDAEWYEFLGGGKGVSQPGNLNWILGILFATCSFLEDGDIPVYVIEEPIHIPILILDDVKRYMNNQFPLIDCKYIEIDKRYQSRDLKYILLYLSIDPSIYGPTEKVVKL